MLHIKKQSVLSVAAEGANVCRHGKLCWLQVKEFLKLKCFLWFCFWHDFI